MEEDTREIQTVTGTVTKIAQAVVEGNSHYYLMIEGSDEIFDVSVADYIDVIRYNVGDHVTIEYKAGEEDEHGALGEQGRIESGRIKQRRQISYLPPLGLYRDILCDHIVIVNT